MLLLDGHGQKCRLQACDLPGLFWGSVFDSNLIDFGDVFPSSRLYERIRYNRNKIQLQAQWRGDGINVEVAAFEFF